MGEPVKAGFELLASGCEEKKKGGPHAENVREDLDQHTM